ncbi:hypothetical protein C0584_03630 [Candidatus Parcubacteria bacterium]|nr:MAG: hypothetical protein C0584_03630 [Candidatus Parcubacteria bacterium]
MEFRQVVVNDKMQNGYKYFLSEKMGENFHSDFRPELTPKKMLELGVFGGKYMTDCKEEFPGSWYENAKLADKGYDPELNFFRVRASQSLLVWRRKEWIHLDDPRGWFQWYCRYYMGRRHEDDERQIKRWKAFRRHWSAVKNNCLKGDWDCRPRQRQALLHWAYDSRKI